MAHKSALKKEIRTASRNLVRIVESIKDITHTHRGSEDTPETLVQICKEYEKIGTKTVEYIIPKAREFYAVKLTPDKKEEAVRRMKNAIVKSGTYKPYMMECGWIIEGIQLGRLNNNLTKPLAHRDMYAITCALLSLIGDDNRRK